MYIVLVATRRIGSHVRQPAVMSNLLNFFKRRILLIDLFRRRFHGARTLSCEIVTLKQEGMSLSFSLFTRRILLMNLFMRINLLMNMFKRMNVLMNLNMRNRISGKPAHICIHNAIQHL